MVANALPAQKSGASGSAHCVLGLLHNLPYRAHTLAKREQLRMGRAPHPLHPCSGPLPCRDGLI